MLGRKKIKWSCLVILLIALVLFPSCKTYPSPTIPSSLAFFVPQRADLIAKVEIQEILNDGDFAYLYQQWATEVSDIPRTLPELLSEVGSETGIDPRDFSEAVVFANTSELVDSMGGGFPGVPYFGGLLRGTFSEENLIKNIEWKTHSKFETYKYKGVKVYTYTEREVAVFSITFVDDQLIVVGSASAVEDTIDIMVGDKQPLSGVVYDLYESLGNVLFKLASSVPGSLTRQVPSTADLDHTDFSLRPLRDTNMVTYTFSKIGSTIITEVQLHFAYADSAQDIDELVHDLKAFLLELIDQEAPGPEIEQLIKHSLDKVETTVYGSVFSLRITETTTDIEDLIRSLVD